MHLTGIRILTLVILSESSGAYKLLKMAQNTKENGTQKAIKSMAEVCIYGQMALFTTASGKTIFKKDLVE